MKYIVNMTDTMSGKITVRVDTYSDWKKAMLCAQERNEHLWRFHNDRAEYQHYWVKESK